MITNTSQAHQNPKTSRPLSVASVKKINAIVALLNALPPAQPGLRSCPADFGIGVRLAFYARRGVAPLAVASVDPEGCGRVVLTIDGTEQPGLEGGSSLIRQIDHVLGVKLDTSPAHHSSEPSCAMSRVCTTRVNFP